MNATFKKDLYRVLGREKETLRQRLRRSADLNHIRLFRNASEAKNPIARKWWTFKLRRSQRKTLIEIPGNTKIGPGFYIGHSGPIIINPAAVLGKNVNISHGVTIGRENRGKRCGTPTIGNEVWIGANAVIVGNITIGDDVLIAPLSYVNFDVPSHSIVVGNPAKIIARENATEGYLSWTV